MVRAEDERFWIESASGAARNPSGWLASAESLWRAALAVHSVWEDDLRRLREFGFQRGRLRPAGWPTYLDENPLRPMVGQVYMLLAGLAVENLLKGLAVVRTPGLVQPRAGQPRRLFQWAGSGHVSRRLAAEAGADLTLDEKSVVDRLEVFTTWGGRYPVPLDALKMAHRAGEGDPPASWSSADIPILEHLFERLRDDLQREAVEQATRSAEATARDRATKRPRLLERLTKLEKREVEGVTLFEVPVALADEPGSSTACVTCGAQFTLNTGRPAAICRCGILYHGEPRWDGSLGREIFNVELYPP